MGLDDSKIQHDFSKAAALSAGLLTALVLVFCHHAKQVCADPGRLPRPYAVLPANHLATQPNEFLTKWGQSPLIAEFSIDRNKQRTYKNVSETQETEMLTFLKDFAAFITLGAFTVGSLTWMDVLTRLV